MQKLKLDLESLRKIETFEYKLDIFLKLDSNALFGTIPNLPLIV